MVPVTQQYSLSWRPEVRFFERRLDPLRALEDQGKVRSFTVQDAEIAVQIEGPYQEIRYGPSGVTARVADTRASVEVVFGAIEEVFRILEPAKLGLARANLQFLETLDGDYDELRTEWGERLVAPPKGISISDWALLINPDVLNTKPPWGGALEFGVVQGAEAAPRLARAVGKLAGEPLGEPSDRIELPEVAFFADANFASTEAIADRGDGLLQALLSAWTTIGQKTSELVAKIREDFTGGES